MRREAIAWLLLATLQAAVRGQEDLDLWYTVFTPDNGETDRHSTTWFTAENEHFIFEVQACNDALVGLAPEPWITTNIYEVNIGQNGNTKVLIRKDDGGVHSVASDDLLHCDELRPFWISWYNTNITVGRGKVIGAEIIINWQDSDPRFIGAVSLTTGWGSTGKWVMARDVGRAMMYHTPAVREYDYIWLNVAPTLTRVNFLVQACMDVLILLKADTGESEVEIIIGKDNELTRIRNAREGNNVATAETPGILSCDEPRPFWITWKENYYYVGRGLTYGEELIVEWQDERTFTTALLQFSTSHNSEGLWEFRHFEGESWILNTPSAYPTTDAMVDVGTVRSFVFRVKACDSARLDLSSNAQDADSVRYSFLIGVDNNQKVTLQDEDGASTWDAANVLSCAEYREFWITWDVEGAKRLELGAGTAVHENTLATHDVVTSHGISVLAFLNHGSEQSMKWDIPQHSGRELVFHTNPSTLNPHGAMWLTLLDKTSITFHVSSCDPVTVALSKYLGNYQSSGYIVLIGEEGNSKSAIINMADNARLVEAATQGVLSCTYARWFWVTWSDGELSVGSSRDVGINPIMSTPMPTDGVVNAVGFGVQEKDLTSLEPARWSMADSLGSVYVKRTTGHSYFDNGWIAVAKDSMVFRLYGCRTANITLSVDPVVRTTHSYVVILGNSALQIQVYKDDATNPIVDETFSTPDLLSCDGYKLFWLSWGHSVIAFGSGETVGENVLGEEVTLTAEQVLAVTSLAVDNMEPGSSAEGLEWVIPQAVGHLITVNTAAEEREGYSLNYAMTVEGNSKVFQVQTCCGAEIILSSSLTLDFAHLYVIVIQDKTSSYTFISKTLSGGDPLASTHQENLVHCSEMRYFWVQWGERIVLGQGHIVGENVLLEAVDNDPVPVNYMKLGSSEFENPGSWIVSQDFDNVYVSKLLPDHTHGTVLLNTERRVFEFTVNSCHTHHVGLFTSSDASQMAFDLKFSYADSTVSLRDGAGTTVASEVVPRLLDCHNKRQFWLSYHLGSVAVGRGRYNYDPILHYNDEATTVVNTLSFYSDMLAQSSEYTLWEVYMQTGDRISSKTIASKSYDQYWMTVPGQDGIVFGLKTCPTAYVLLSTALGVTHTAGNMQVHFSNDQISFLDNNGDTVTTRQNTDTLLCDSEVYLWISWKDSLLEAGTGTTLRLNTVIAHNLPDTGLQVAALAFSTESQIGEWYFGSHRGNVMSLKADAGMEYSTAWIAPYTRNEYVLFDVMACDEVRLGMYHTTVVAPESVLKLGAVSNSEIQYLENDIVVASAKTPGILQCTSYVAFWLVLNHGVDLGTGLPLGNTLLTHVSDHMEPVRLLSVTGSPDDNAKWQFPMARTKWTRVNTYGEYGYERFAMGVAGETSVVFSVQACKSVHVFLAQTAHNIHAGGYEVVIEEKTGDLTSIRNGIYGTVEASLHRTGLLNCDHMRTFWISWQNAKIELGQGGDVFSGSLLNWTDPAPKTIKSVAVDTAHEEYGVFDFLTLAGNTVTRLTNDDATVYEHMWYDPVNTYIRFTVQTCYNARLALSAWRGQTDTDTYEVIIGGEENQKTRIKSSVKGSDIVATKTPDVLNCYEKRSFWVSWDNKTVSLGTGELYASTILTTGYMADMHTVNSVGICTYTNTGDAVWDIVHEPDAVIESRISGTYGYTEQWLSVVGQTSIKFAVKVCTDAHLALAMIPYETGSSTTEVVIGGWENMKSAIRKTVNAEEDVFVDTPEILSCSEYRQFWTSWVDGHIKVGTGTVVGENQFMEYEQETVHPIHSVGFSGAMNNDGVWLFGTDEIAETTLAPPLTTKLPDYITGETDNVYIFKTPSTDERDYTYMWMVSEIDYIVFEVQACAEASIVLTKTPYVTSSNTYEIIIGYYANQQTIIRKEVASESAAAKEDTPDVLSCDELRPFWISWTGGLVQVGRGNVTGSDVIVSYDHSSPYTIGAKSFGTHQGNEGIWKILKDSGRSVYSETPGIFGYTNMWVTEHHREHVIFCVATCHDALLALAQYFGDTDNSYEVVIGGWEGQESAIRDAVQGEDKVRVSTPGILACNDDRYFWISWKSGLIEVGKGVTVGSERFMYWQDDAPHNVSAIGISGWTQPGTWQFTTFDSNQILAMSEETAKNQDIRVEMTRNKEFIFKVRACSNALLDILSSEGNKAVEFILANDNGEVRVELFEEDGTPILVEVWPATNLLHCDAYRVFWLTWESEIVFGRGRGETIGRVTDPVQGRVYETLTLGTAVDNNLVEWMYDKEAAPTSTLYTHGDSDEPIYWITDAGVQEQFVRVQACADVRFWLTKYVKNNSIKRYEIRIGGTGNTRCLILRESTEVARVEPISVLDCNVAKYLHIRWAADTIEVLEGGQSVISYHDDSPLRVRHLGLNTVSAELGIFQFSHVPVNSYHITTPSTENAELFRISTHKHVFVFDVKACSHMQVALSDGAQATHVVQIDYAGKLIIKPLTGNGNQVELSAVLLDCERYKTLWISWSAIRLTVGEELSYQNELLAMDVVDLEVKVISLVSGTGYTGEWVISQQSGKVYDVHTPSAYGYDTLWTYEWDREWFLFEVQTCADAHVALSEAFGDYESKTYEVVIGGHGNTKSEIRNTTSGHVVVSADTESILNCDAYVKFWISWTNNFLQVGTGSQIGSDAFLEWQDPTPHAVHSVGISTSSSQEGLWRLSHIQEEVYLVQSRYDLNYARFTLSVPRREIFEFKVQACDNAFVGLYSHALRSMAYEVVFGYNNNKQVVIVDVGTGDTVASTQYKNVVSCNIEKAFWISWAGKTISVGQGPHPQSIVLEYKPEEAFDSLTAVSITNGNDADDAPAYWEIAKDQGERLDYATIANGGYEELVLTVRDGTQFVFGAMTCGQLAIALSAVPALTAQMTYEVIIADTKITIKDDGNVVSETTIPGLLSCSHYLYYWIKWADYKIEVGQGVLPGASRLVWWQDHDEAHRHDVTAVALATVDSTGEWILAHADGNLVSGNTHGANSNHVFLWAAPLRTQTSWTFNVKACAQSRIALAVDPLNWEFDSYEVVFGCDNSDSNARIKKRKADGSGWNIKEEAEWPELMKCDVMQKFWISWQDGVIQAGEGIPYQNLLISWTDESPLTPRGVSMTTSGDFTGLYDFLEETADLIKTKTEGDRDYDRYWHTVMGRERIVVQIKACKKALIVLATSPYVYNDAVEINILKDDGTTTMTNKTTGAVLALADVPGILHCDEYRTFWVNFKQGEGIHMGHGADMSSEPFLSWQDEAVTFLPTSYSLESHGSTRADFYIPVHETNVYTLQTREAEPDYSHYILRVDPASYHTAAFHVRACRDAHLLLAVPFEQWSEPSFDFM